MSLAQTLSFILSHPMNRGRPLSALARFAGWQARSRLAPGPHAVPFVDDIDLYVTRGMSGATGNIYCGLHEWEEMGFLLHFLRPGDLFVDVGANVGSYSLLAAATGARVIAFEPAEAHEGLRRNVDGNGLGDRIDVRRSAVGRAAGTVRFTQGRDCTNQVARDGEAGVEVPVVALDDLGLSPALMKIDVEGYEPEVLAGAGRTLAATQAVIMELLGPHKDELRRTMGELGFRAYGYDPLTRKLTEDRVRNNGIFVRGDVAERLATAPRRRVAGRWV